MHAALPPSGYSGFALAPAVQGHLHTGARSTPYVGVGVQYARLSKSDVTASGTGFFANLGYEWKWASGLGVQLGGGVQYMPEISATNGSVMITREGGASLNLEAGVRYTFL